MVRHLLVVFALAVLLPTAAVSQPAYLVHDLGIDSPVAAGLTESQPVRLHGISYFFHNDGQHGRELWRSDGTPAGTQLVKDVCPGTCGADIASPSDLAVSGNLIYFGANDGVHGTELWITDGTAGGTRLVLDIRPGVAASRVGAFHVASGLLFFLADDGMHGVELWRSDGTPGGTYLVKDITANPEARAIEAIQVGVGRLWLLAGGEADSEGLWSSDGTTAGTSKVLARRPYHPGWAGASNPMALLPDGTAVLPVEASDQRMELWRTDGTADGTFRLHTFRRFTSLAVVVAGHFAYFQDQPEGATCAKLFRTDGTVSGTRAVDLLPSACVQTKNLAVAAGGKFVFAAALPESGLEPWVTTGFETSRLGDLYPGAGGSLDSPIPGMFARGVPVPTDRAVFLANPADNHGLVLEVTDGTPSGTRPLERPAPSNFPYSCAVNPDSRPLFPSEESLLLPCWEETTGPVIWEINLMNGRSAPYAALPSHLSGLVAPIADAITIGEPGCFSALNGRLIVSAHTGLRAAMVVSTDGSIGGAEALVPAKYSETAYCPGEGDKLLVEDAPADSQYAELFLTNGLPEGTSPNHVRLIYASPVRPATTWAADRWLVGDGSRLYQLLPPQPSITQIADIDLGAGPRQILVSKKGAALFGGHRLRSLDTETGVTQELVELGPQASIWGAIPGPNGFVFLADTENEGIEIWWTDGTAAGTRLPRDIAPGPTSSFATEVSYNSYLRRTPVRGRMEWLGDQLLFAANDGVHGEELWISDGTAAGTFLVADLFPGSYPSSPRQLTRIGDQVVFVAEHPWLGRELWTTDGTEAGTRLLLDLAPGVESSGPEHLAFLEGRLYFSAWTPAFGREPWVLDPQPFSTRRLADIAPGAESSSPGLFYRLDGRLYFAADDGIHGSELWAISDDGSVPLFRDGWEGGGTQRWDGAAF